MDCRPRALYIGGDSTLAFNFDSKWRKHKKDFYRKWIEDEVRPHFLMDKEVELAQY